MDMVLLRAVCGRFGSTFYIALTLVSVASMIVTYVLGRRFARELGASAPLSSAIAAVYSIGTARLFTAGMEAVLTVPLFLWLLIEVARGGPVTPRRASTLGLMASLVILARLDIAIAVALLLAGFVLFVRPPRRRSGGRLSDGPSSGGTPTRSQRPFRRWYSSASAGRPLCRKAFGRSRRCGSWRSHPPSACVITSSNARVGPSHITPFWP
jgi:hypothetical protein